MADVKLYFKMKNLLCDCYFRVKSWAYSCYFSDTFVSGKALCECTIHSLNYLTLFSELMQLKSKFHIAQYGKQPLLMGV